MSKIYDALQIAYGERPASPDQAIDVTGKVQESKAYDSPSTLIPVEPLVSIKKFYQEPELLALAQNIAAHLPSPDKNVIQFISAKKGEGTSTLVRELALACAQHSRKPVLLVEADLKQPSQYQAFQMEASPPLDHVLKEGKALDGAVSQFHNSNLFLACLSSKIQAALTERNFFSPSDMWKLVRERFSLVLLDSSPVGITSDSLALCETVDGIVLVVEAEKTRSAVVKSVRDQILMREGNLLGIVFNKRKLHIPNFIYKFL